MRGRGTARVRPVSVPSRRSRLPTSLPYKLHMLQLTDRHETASSTSHKRYIRITAGDRTNDTGSAALYGNLYRLSSYRLSCTLWEIEIAIIDSKTSNLRHSKMSTDW